MYDGIDLLTAFVLGMAAMSLVVAVYWAGVVRRTAVRGMEEARGRQPDLRTSADFPNKKGDMDANQPW